LLGELLLALEQVVELLLVQRLELAREGAAMVNPQTHGIFQGAGDVQQNPAAVVPSGQIQGAVQLAFLAAAGGFAAGAAPLDQGAAQEGLLGDQLGEAGTCVPLCGGALRTLAHGVSFAVLT
jgi:hypothetical protein